MNTRVITKLPWPENLLRLIFKYEGYDEWKTHIPPDFEESLEFVLEETLTERETYILYAYYRDKVCMRIIGERYDIQAQRCYQIKELAIRRLRHPKRTKYLRLGLAEAARQHQEPPKVISVEKRSINELDLSVRAYNCIRRLNIYTIEDLTHFSKSQLMSIRNMGVRTVGEVERKLKEKGLALRQDDE